MNEQDDLDFLNEPPTAFPAQALQARMTKKSSSWKWVWIIAAGIFFGTMMVEIVNGVVVALFVDYQAEQVRQQLRYFQQAVERLNK